MEVARVHLQVNSDFCPWCKFIVENFTSVNSFVLHFLIYIFQKKSHCPGIPQSRNSLTTSMLFTNFVCTYDKLDPEILRTLHIENLFQFSLVALDPFHRPHKGQSISVWPQ